MVKKMNITDFTIYNIIKSSAKKLYRNIHWVLLVMVIDLVFIFALSLVMTLIQVSAIDHLTGIMEMGGAATGGLANMYETPTTVMYGLQGLSQDQIFQFHVKRLVLYLVLMVAAGYLFWILFQGLSWWLVHRFSVEKQGRQSYLRYLKNFSLQSFLYYFIFVILMVLWIKYYLSIKTSLTPWLFGTSFLDWLFWILTTILWYFGVLSYTMVNKESYKNVKESFVLGTKKLLYTGQTLVVIAILFTAIHFFLKIPFIVHNKVVYTVLGLLLVLPYFVFGRILFFETRKTYWPMISIHKDLHKPKSHRPVEHKPVHKHKEHPAHKIIREHMAHKKKT